MQPSLGELMAVLSLGIDLGLGQPMEHVLRQWVIALGLAERAGLEPTDAEIVSFVTLIGFVGCHADSHEQARWFGDDIQMRADIYTTDLTPRKQPPFVMRHVGLGRPPLQRARTLADFVALRAQRGRRHAHHPLHAGRGLRAAARAQR